MDLPETSMLNLFNKVLISLADLSPDGKPCSVKSLIVQCQAVAFGGHLGNYDLIMQQCNHCGLLNIKGKNVVLSVLGQSFLKANRDRYFEITEAQKNIVAERIVFKGAWSQYARGLFEHFKPNMDTTTYELSTIDISLPKKHSSAVHLFRYLGILYENEYSIAVDRKYTELVYQLTADRRAVSEQELEKIMMENRKLGSKAENAVVEFERQRLKRLGREAQAAMVQRISTINTAAGYDIESFDGVSEDEFVPNRFIEVKATQSERVRFYWTRNEKKVAAHKRSKYWIYFLRLFKEDKPEESRPIMIQDPNKSIDGSSFLTMESYKFLIEEIDEVKLSEHTLKDMTWYQIV